MRTVNFGVYWMAYGRQTIELPDDVSDDPDEITDYIRSVWDEVPLPEGEYVDGSDELDIDAGIRITGKRDNPTSREGGEPV